MARKIEVVIVGDETALTAALGKASAQVEGFAGKMQKAGSSLRKTGGALTRNLTLPIVVAGGAATKYAYDFEQSMNHIQALVGANTKQMAQYKSAILALAPAVGQGPKELSDALYFITSSGYSGAAALKVLKASAVGAATGLGDTKTIADLVTSAVTVYGQKNLSAAHAVDILTQAVKDGKGEPAEYATTLGRVIPVANALGISFDQSAAALASLTLSGFSADKAATGLSSIFTNLSKPTTTGAEALKKVGLSYAGIRQEIVDKGLLPALMDMNQAFDGNQVALRQVFSSGKAIVPFLALTGKAAGTTAKVFNDLAHSSGASADAMAVQQQTTAFKMQKALATIQVAAVQLGGILLPVFASVATAAAGLAASFGQLPAAGQQIVVVGALAAAALGPVLTVMGNIAIVASNGAKAMKLFAGSLTLAEAGAGGVTAAFVLAAVAIGAVAYITYQGTKSGAALGLAFDGAAKSAQQLTGAMNALGAAESATTQANFAHRQAVLDVASSQRAVNLLSREGKKGTLEYKQAVLALDEAQQRANDTRKQASDDQRKQTRLTRQAGDAVRGLSRQMREATKTSNFLQDSADRAGRSLHTDAQRTHEYEGGLQAVEKAALAAAAKFALTDKAAARSAASIARAASAAIGLAQALNRIPTQKEINIFVRTSHIDAARGEGTNKYHNALGTENFPGGWSWVGERGPELLRLPRGTQIKSNADSNRMVTGATVSGDSGPSPSILGGSYSRRRQEMTVSFTDAEASRLDRSLNRRSARRG